MKSVFLQDRKLIQNIELRDITLFDEDGTLLIENVNLSFSMGRFIHIKGPSGCGKTTLLGLIAGIFKNYAGDVYINDKDISEYTFEEFLAYRLNIGYAFESGGLLNNLTIRQNLELPLHYHKALPPHEIKTQVDSLLGLFNIEKYQHKAPSKIPTGIKKSASIARAVILSPQVLLLDDPISGMSEEGIDALEYLLVDWSLLKTDIKPLVIITGKEHTFLNRWVDEEIVFDQNEHGHYSLKVNQLNKTQEVEIA